MSFYLNMALQVIGLPILIIIAIIVAVIVYVKTKSWAKVGYLFEIIIPVIVFFLTFMLSNSVLFVIINLLGLALLINGLIRILK